MRFDLTRWAYIIGFAFLLIGFSQSTPVYGDEPAPKTQFVNTSFFCSTEAELDNALTQFETEGMYNIGQTSARCFITTNPLRYKVIKVIKTRESGMTMLEATNGFYTIFAFTNKEINNGQESINRDPFQSHT